MASHMLAAPPTDAGMDSDLENFEGRVSTSTWLCSGSIFALWQGHGHQGAWWSATKLGYVVPIKVTPTWRPGPKGSQKNIAPSITQAPVALSASWCSLGRTPTHTTIHVIEKKRRPASPSPPWWSYDDHQPTVGQSNSKSIHSPLYPTPSTYISSYSLHEWINEFTWSGFSITQKLLC